MAYKTRRRCGAEDSGSSPGDFGNGEGWHYVYEDQTTIDEDAVCPDHTSAPISHFSIQPPEEIV